MASRLKSPARTASRFPSWAECAAITLLVIWLLGLVAVEAEAPWMHLLLPLSFGVIAISFWSGRPSRGGS